MNVGQFPLEILDNSLHELLAVLTNLKRKLSRYVNEKSFTFLSKQSMFKKMKLLTEQIHSLYVNTLVNVALEFYGVLR